MSKDICITKKVTYGPPCFIDVNGPNCEYKTTECGIGLKDIQRNAATEKLFQAASLTGFPEILSHEDIVQYVKGEAGASLLLPEVRGRINVNIARFKEDANALVEKYRILPGTKKEKTMTTVSEKIRKIAALYPEPRTYGDVGVLSKMDFLASQALDGNPEACRMVPGAGFVAEAECYREREAALAADPDGFITRNLGEPGDVLRQGYERRAQALYESAKKYESSKEVDTIDSSFDKEQEAIKRHFDHVLEVYYGRYALSFPFKGSPFLRGVLLFLLDVILTEPSEPKEQRSHTVEGGQTQKNIRRLGGSLFDPCVDTGGVFLQNRIANSGCEHIRAEPSSCSGCGCK